MHRQFTEARVPKASRRLSSLTLLLIFVSTTGCAGPSEQELVAGCAGHLMVPSLAETMISVVPEMAERCAGGSGLDCNPMNYPMAALVALFTLPMQPIIDAGARIDYDRCVARVSNRDQGTVEDAQPRP